MKFPGQPPYFAGALPKAWSDWLSAMVAYIQSLTPGGSGGVGTVTSVDTGAGLTGGPITTSGTISMASTGVAAGSYTLTNLTVDTLGRATAASNGGSTGSTDNAVLRADGTGGATVQSSSVLVDDGGEIHGFAAKLNQQTGTTYTLAATDTGKIVECSNASSITVTLPNSLSVGWCCTLMQTGAGQVTFSAASGAGFTAYNSKTKTAGQYAAVTIWVHQNSGGSAAQYRIAGTMA